MNQLKAGALLNYIVIILNTLVGLLYTPYMLRMMGQSEYGLYSLVASVIAYLTVLDLGFGNAIIRYTAKFKAEGKLKEQYEMFGMFLVLYVVIGIIAFILGLGLYYNIDVFFGQTMTPWEVERAQIMVLMLVINLSITFPLSIFGSIINAYEHFVFPRAINVIRILLNTLVMVLLLMHGYKAVAMVFVQTVFNIATLVLNWIYCMRKLKIKILFARFDWSFLKEVSIYSFWIFLFVIMDRVYWSTGQFVLGAVSGTFAVAVYAIAIQLQNMYMQFSNAIASLFLPKITNIVTRNDDKKVISDLFIKTGRIQYVILVYILAAFLVLGRQFINLWAGPDYEESFVIACIFFIPLTIPLIQNIGITILQARNQMQFRSILYICIAILSLFFQVILSKKFGGIGCAIAVSGALILGQIIIMNIYYSIKQYIDIISFWKEIFKMSIMPVVLGILFYVIFEYLFILDDWWKFSLGGMVFTLFYLPFFYITSMNNEEKQLVSSMVLKIKHIYR